jgi:hypothetical protein
VHKIPVLLLVPERLHENAKKVLGDVAEKVKLVDSKNALDEIIKILG